jgi:hypothetical protein
MSRIPSRAEWATPSVAALVAANLLPVYGALFLGWDVFPILLLFWLENVIIGVFNVLRMLIAQPTDPMAWVRKAFFIPFFSVHYGIFTAIHGVFVIMMFGRQALPTSALPDVHSLAALIARLHLGYAMLALFLSHAFSFAWNYIGRGEYRVASVENLTIAPYGRVVILHLTILLGGFLMLALDSPKAGLVLLVVLKIGMDIVAHAHERRKMTPPPTLPAAHPSP